MRRSEIRVLILRVGGTNCDRETALAFRDLGVEAEVVHTHRVVREGSLPDYDVLVFPGGFSYGDYVRSGVIWAKLVEAYLLEDLMKFVEEGHPVIGICNGFQLLVELGLLPGFEGRSPYPEAALPPNAPRYVKPDGSFAEGEYPHNPNGSFHDIAGICSPEGNVFGLMPHPERAYYGWQLPDWTRMGRPPEYGDGRLILEGIVEYVERRF